MLLSSLIFISLEKIKFKAVQCRWTDELLWSVSGEGERFVFIGECCFGFLCPSLGQQWWGELDQEHRWHLVCVLLQCSKWDTHLGGVGEEMNTTVLEFDFWTREGKCLRTTCFPQGLLAVIFGQCEVSVKPVGDQEWALHPTTAHPGSSWYGGKASLTPHSFTVSVS